MAYQPNYNHVGAPIEFNGTAGTGGDSGTLHRHSCTFLRGPFGVSWKTIHLPKPPTLRFSEILSIVVKMLTILLTQPSSMSTSGSTQVIPHTLSLLRQW